MRKVIRIGTRGSRMALAQANMLQKLFLDAYPNIETTIEIVKTTSDVVKGSLKEVGGKGAFVREIDEALVDGRIDIALNCMKDIPGDHERTQGVITAAVLPREACEDALICRKGVEPKDLPDAPHIGTCSPRRVALLKKIYPKASISMLRGNADTRIGRLDNGDFDAIILAKAGLYRIGEESRITKTFSIEEMLPAAGQGVLTLDCKEGNNEIIEILQVFNHKETYAMMQAERGMLNTLRGNCYSAVAALATLEGNGLRLVAKVMSPDGEREILAEGTVPSLEDASSLGLEVGESLLAQGARELLG